MELRNDTLPETGLVQAKEMVQVIDERLGGALDSVGDEDKLANALGHQTTDSGAFHSKLADLAKYDLLTGRGERQLTPRAETLLKNESEVAREIIEELGVYKRAYERFQSEMPSPDEWRQFLDELGIDDADQRDEIKSWKLYLELARRLGPNESYRGTVEIPEEEFQDYLKRLEDERTREYAIKALKDLTHHPLPSADIFQELLTKAKKEEYPDYTADFVKILRNVCYKSADLVTQYEEELIEFAFDQLREADDSKVRQDAWSILTRLLPSKLDADRAHRSWDIANELLEDSVQEEDGDKRRHAARIVRKLADDWIVGQDDVIRAMEDEIWDAIGVSDELDSVYDSWLRKFREARGIAR